MDQPGRRGDDRAGRRGSRAGRRACPMHVDHQGGLRDGHVVASGRGRACAMHVECRRGRSRRILHRSNRAWDRRVSRQIGQVVFAHMVTCSRFSGKKRENISQRRDIDSDPRSGIGKNKLVENNITGDVDTSHGTIKTLVSLMHRTIAQENTHGG